MGKIFKIRGNVFMIFIISCGKSKEKITMPAYKLYNGCFFKSCLKYALMFVNLDNVYILSAKYGLIGLREEIKPYKVSIVSAGKAKENGCVVLSKEEN